MKEIKAYIHRSRIAPAGAVNLTLAFDFGADLPGATAVVAATALGFFAYGVSLALFALGLRHLGAGAPAPIFRLPPSSERCFRFFFWPSR